MHASLPTELKIPRTSQIHAINIYSEWIGIMIGVMNAERSKKLKPQKKTHK